MTESEPRSTTRQLISASRTAVTLVALLLLVGCDRCTISWLSCSGNKAPEFTLKVTKIPLRLTRKVASGANVGEFVLKIIAGDTITTEYGDIPVDLALILNNLITTQSIFSDVDKNTPVLLLIDKKRNQYQCWKLKPYVKEIVLKTGYSKSVVLRVINKTPLQIELWVDTDKPIDIDVILKEEK